MPLPTVLAGAAPQCRAKAKHSSTRCLNPAAHGMPVCRKHGARRPETVRRGRDHPAYVRGEQTQFSQAQRSAKLAELRDLELAMVQLGMLQGKRWPGRKPKAV